MDVLESGRQTGVAAVAHGPCLVGATMLKAIPKAWFSWDFDILDPSGQSIAKVDMSAWREKATFAIGDVSCRIYRERLMSGAFLLEAEGSVLARAIKPSAFRDSFVVDYDGRQYTLGRRSVFGREYILKQDSREIGSMAPEAWFTRKVIVNLPDDLPLAVRVFVVVLVLILWKRDSNAAAAAGGAS
jgi:hypothetical protein